MVAAAGQTAPGEVLGLLDLMCDLLGARAARFYVADYSLRWLQQVDLRGRVGVLHTVAGTLVGRAFTSSHPVIAGTDPTLVAVPLVDGTSRVGVLELEFDDWGDDLRDLLDPIVTTFVTTWILKSRYSDAAARARRTEPLTPAAEAQWDLLPPLSCTTDRVAVSGTLEPAYDIGGDSFDYACDASRLDFAIVDAIGNGLPAVLMSAAAISSLRNSRREDLGLVTAYERADRSIAAQFGHSYFVTGIIATLDLGSGTLTWVNAGHLLPMLVRNGSYAGTLGCQPSRPLGLGGGVVEVAEVVLQRGDRVLFYTDGISESRSSDGSFFGDHRLADYLVRAALEELPVQDTLRRITHSLIDFNDNGLRDDATMFLLEWTSSSE